MDDKKVIRFPITYSQRRKNQLGPRVVECEVSGRLLCFHEESVLAGKGEFITVDVFAMPEEDKKTRKLCQLIVTRENLLEALANVRPKEDTR